MSILIHVFGLLEIFFSTEILTFQLLARKGTCLYNVLLTFVAPLYCSADKPFHWADLISFTAHTCGGLHI